MDGNQRNSAQIQSKLDELDRLMADEKRMHAEAQHYSKVKQNRQEKGGK
jgi:Tfp pilus assembly protein PilN